MIPITGWGLSDALRMVGRRDVPLVWAGNQPDPSRGLLLQALDATDHFSRAEVVGSWLRLLSSTVADGSSGRSVYPCDSFQTGLGGWGPQADSTKHYNFLSSVGRVKAVLLFGAENPIFKAAGTSGQRLTTYS